MRRLSIASSWILGCTLLNACVAAPAATDRPMPDRALDVYAKPAKLVRIDAGRRLNLRCMGNGAPTVLLESGAMADSMSWSKVQPLVARSTRVCAYDRAGLGFSDAGPLPRDVDAAVADLHALVRTAKIATPLVLVGHSLGSNIARRYADRYPSEVAGLVLADPPPQHIAEFSAAWVETDDAMRAQGLEFYRACEKGAQQGQLAAPPPALKACLRGPDPAYSDALNAALRKNKARPAFWQTVISVTETNGDLFKQPIAPSERHGATPLIVLTAEAAYAAAPPADRRSLEDAQNATHERLAATSTRGERIRVARASHDLQLDSPDAVADAVGQVLTQIRSTPATTAEP